MVDQLTILILAPIFFAISFVYSSVGFAGGSSYIAILVLAGVSLYTVPPISLALNIIAASMAFINYARARYFSLKFSIPFLSSLPFVFFAGLLVLPERSLVLVFVIALFAASAAFLASSNKISTQPTKIRKLNLSNTKLALIGVPVGAVLGVVAGLVGIAADTASFFIVTNSIIGLLAHSISRSIDLSLLVPLAVVVLVGGFIGSKFGAFKLDHDKIIMIVAAVVAVAGIELTIKLLV